MCSDVEQLDADEIDAIAAFLHGEQLRQLEEAARRVQRALPADAPVVAVGSGAFLGREVAARLGRAVADVPAPWGATGGEVAPAAALAALLAARAVLTVVKVGGGLGRGAGDDALRALCATLGELGERHPLLVVPGGAWFADAVRDADRRFGAARGDLAPHGGPRHGAVRLAAQRADPGRRALRRPALARPPAARPCCCPPRCRSTRCRRRGR